MEFPVEKMCRVMEVSRSGYYKWLQRKPSRRAERTSRIREEIRVIYKEHKGRYGSPRITKDLAEKGIEASKVLVAKLMKQENLRSITRRKHKVTTQSSHKYPVVDNRLSREFTVDGKNKAWVSDITYIGTKEGWTYLTTVIDLFDRKVVGWALSDTMYTKETTVAALHMALINRPLQPDQQLILHSDRGVQYACKDFVGEVSKHKNIVRSMSRKGDCWDNAVAESFFKTLKVELVYHNKYQTRQQAELSIFEYIEAYYNTVRRHKHLNNLSITEYNQQFINNLKMAA